jgi:uncharacterized membrane protein
MKNLVRLALTLSVTTVALLSPTAHAAFRFCNKYPRTVWVAFSWWSPGCAGRGPSDPWNVAGWWRLAPGECAVVYGEDLQDVNQFYYFYAEAEDGSVWDGSIKRWVYSKAFEYCSGAPVPYVLDPNDRGREVGFREVYVGFVDDYTIDLLP